MEYKLKQYGEALSYNLPCEAEKSIISLLLCIENFIYVKFQTEIVAGGVVSSTPRKKNSIFPSSLL
jgi:hypothetical protein